MNSLWHVQPNYFVLPHVLCFVHGVLAANRWLGCCGNLCGAFSTLDTLPDIPDIFTNNSLAPLYNLTTHMGMLAIL